MALRWQASEDGAVELDAYLARIEGLMSDMREPLEDAKDYIQSVIELQFDTEGVARSGGWEPLNEDYSLWKARRAPGEPMLRLTREMFGIVTDDASWFVSDTDAVYEPPSQKAGWHQEGVLYRRGGGRDHNRSNPLPARPILELNEADYQHIDNLFEDWIGEILQS